MRTSILSSIIIFASLFLVACGEKPVVEEGDSISVHYVGTLDDGEEFDSSRGEGRVPLEFVVGDGTMIPGFDAGVRGLTVGEKTTIRIESVEAYGDAIMQQTLPLSTIQDVAGEDVALVIGQEYEPANNPPFSVMSIEDENVTIEFENTHPLAGQALNFDIEIVDVQKATAE